ncbi:unnamed protein product [Euphydryas editha]|uniref:Carboxylesterase type B domain-containing protein n=1 Tax=Euphydryas editha TaxID=104508 RepID=A0AAU9UR86_EUPED|nr:unnamed protein product [Euphydryas editha]
MINAVNEFLDDLRGGRMIESPIVRVEEGELQGKLVNSPTGKAFYSFQGIPYAKPPIGSLRFKAPQPPEPWEGVRDATSEGNSCAQVEYFVEKQYLGDENCLFLNVSTPNLDGEFLPVMVFIHGGAYRMGSGSSSLYGADYLVEKDVVIVTINYRCGPLGFLCLNTPEVPGNAGLKDVVQALRWIKENIKNFGGNSGNITVFGESCGGAIVSLLTASPLSKNMISKAILQSGTALNCWSHQLTPLENAKALAHELGCESTDVSEIYEFLMTTPVKDMVEAFERIAPWEVFSRTGESLFAPVVEKEFPGVEAFLTEAFIDVLTSGRLAEVPVMIGSTTLELPQDKDSDDFQSYIPSDLHIERNTEESLAIAEKIKTLYIKGNPSSVESLTDKFHLMSDYFINIDIHRYIKYLVNNTNKPIYYYKFDYVGELNISSNFLKSLDLKHAGHMDELGYLFKNDLQKDVEPTPQDIKMRERMLRLWTNFAKSGNPTPDENHYLTVTWLPITKDNLYYLNLGNELSLGTNPDKDKMEFWEELYSKYYKIWDHPKTNESVVPVTEKLEFSTAPVIVEETVITSVTTVNDNVETKETHVTVSETSDNIEQVQTSLIIESNDGIQQTQQSSIIDAPTEIVKENVIDTKPEIVQEEVAPTPVHVTSNIEQPEDFGINIGKIQEKFETPQNGVEEIKFNGNSDKKPRPSNEIKMVQSNNINPKDVIRANDPPEDDLPKNIGVNKFVNFFESLGGKK